MAQTSGVFPALGDNVKKTTPKPARKPKRRYEESVWDAVQRMRGDVPSTACIHTAQVKK